MNLYHLPSLVDRPIFGHHRTKPPTDGPLSSVPSAFPAYGVGDATPLRRSLYVDMKTAGSVPLRTKPADK